MNYLIYTRVSPKGSDWIGSETTVVDQAIQCRGYIVACDPKGKIVGEIQDEFESGGSSKRPGWLQIISEVKTGTAAWDVLVVRHLDRFSRSISDAVNALELFHANGKYLIATAQGLNSSTPSGRGVINILLSIAQMEREFAGERTRLKMNSIAAKGLWPVGGTPFGYLRGKKHDNLLYVDEPKAEIVRNIFTRYVQGVGPLTLARDYGIPKNQVLYILKNRTYLGLICYSGREHIGQHEALVTRDLFEAARTRLPDKETIQSRPTARKYPYILTGLVFCQCGRTMTPASAHGRKSVYNYYQCTDIKNCRRRVGAQELEAEIIDILRHIKLDEEDIEKLCQRIRDIASGRRRRDSGEPELLKALDKAQKRKDRLTLMFTEGFVTKDNAADINRELTRASEEVNIIEGRLAAERAENATSPEAVEEMIAFARNLSSAESFIRIADGKPDALRSIIIGWIKEIRQNGDTWDVTLNLLGSPNCTEWLRQLNLKEPLQLFVFGRFKVFLRAA